jgi:hypothetical protein
MSLDWIVWARWLAWLGFGELKLQIHIFKYNNFTKIIFIFTGLIIYFIYGIRNSSEHPNYKNRSVADNDCPELACWQRLRQPRRPAAN